MLTVIAGPMFSGKSSKLISIVKANLVAHNEILAFVPSNDTRYGLHKITTHDGEQIDAEVLDKDSPYTSYYVKDIATTNAVIFIEEAQFFDSHSLLLLVKRLLLENKTVVCAGLPNDFNGEPYGAMPHLLAMADEIISLKAVCSRCKRLNFATKTFRKTKDKAQTIVGGAKMYEPRCFECWRIDDRD